MSVGVVCPITLLGYNMHVGLAELTARPLYCMMGIENDTHLILVFCFLLSVCWSFQAEPWATMELALAVEEVAVCGVHFVFCGAHITLYHSVHHRVKVANPRKLERFVRTASRLDIGA